MGAPFFDKLSFAEFALFLLLENYSASLSAAQSYRNSSSISFGSAHGFSNFFA